MNCVLAESKLHESTGFVGSRYTQNVAGHLVHKYFLGEYRRLFQLTVLMTPIVSTWSWIHFMYLFIHVHMILQCGQRVNYLLALNLGFQFKVQVSLSESSVHSILFLTI